MFRCKNESDRGYWAAAIRNWGMDFVLMIVEENKAVGLLSVGRNFLHLISSFAAAAAVDSLRKDLVGTGRIDSGSDFLEITVFFMILEYFSRV